MPTMAGSMSSVTAATMSSISRRALGCEQLGKALILQIAAEQGAEPRAGDTKRIAAGLIAGQHEDVAEQLAHRIGIDVAAVRRAASPRFLFQ